MSITPVGGNKLAAGSDASHAVSLETKLQSHDAFYQFIRKELDEVCERIAAEFELHRGESRAPSKPMALSSSKPSHELFDAPVVSTPEDRRANRRASNTPQPAPVRPSGGSATSARASVASARPSRTSVASNARSSRASTASRVSTATWATEVLKPSMSFSSNLSMKFLGSGGKKVGAKSSLPADLVPNKLTFVVPMEQSQNAAAAGQKPGPPPQSSVPLPGGSPEPAPKWTSQGSSIFKEDSPPESEKQAEPQWQSQGSIPQSIPEGGSSGEEPEESAVKEPLDSKTEVCQGQVANVAEEPAVDSEVGLAPAKKKSVGLRFMAPTQSDPRSKGSGSSEPSDEEPEPAGASQASKQPFVKQPSHLSHLLHGESGPRNFDLHAPWTKQLDTACGKTPGGFGSFTAMPSEVADRRVTPGSKTRWEKLIIHPSSGPRLAWGVVGLFFMAYESVKVPLTFFSVHDFATAMAVRLFFTCDLLLQFFMGYQTLTGDIQTAPSKVFKHYLRTWFAFDAALIIEDWVDYGALANELVPERVLRCVRMVRLLRMAKLLCVFKHYAGFGGILPNLVRNIDQELLSGSFVIVRNCFLWVWANHVCGCAWYGLGDDHLDGSNWISLGEWADASGVFLYAQSILYSLSMYGCPTDVGTTHVGERYFSIIMMIFAYMVSAYIISSMATGMTQVTIATAQDSKQLSALGMYLSENGISSATSKRVQLNARQAMTQKKRTKQEDDIELLQIISKPLRIELHFEIYGPTLSWHPFFDIAGEESAGLIKQICHQCLSKIMLASRDMVFEEGETSLHQHMYFLSHGECQYRQSTKEFVEQVIVGEWAGEAALWTHWIHCGSMRASQASTIIALESERFQNIATQFGTALGYVQRYASAFCKYLESCEPDQLTDLEDPDMDVEWLASKHRLPPEPRGSEAKIRVSLLSNMPGELAPVTSASMKSVGSAKNNGGIGIFRIMSSWRAKRNQDKEQSAVGPLGRRSRSSHKHTQDVPEKIEEAEDEEDSEDSKGDVVWFAASAGKEKVKTVPGLPGGTS